MISNHVCLGLFPFLCCFSFFFILCPACSLFSFFLFYVHLLLLSSLLFLYFSTCSCLKLRTEWLVIEDHCLFSGPQDLQSLSPQRVCARLFLRSSFLFAPLLPFLLLLVFILIFFPPQVLSLKLDFHLRWTRSTRHVYATFLPSIFLSLFLCLFLTSFCPPFSLLYLLMWIISPQSNSDRSSILLLMVL